MENRFHMTTREVAALAGTTTAAVQRQYQRLGAWRGIAPNKGGNRLLWPRAEVYQAVGMLPDRLTDSESLALSVLGSLGIPSDAATYAVVSRLTDRRRAMVEPVRELWFLSDALEYWLLRAERHGLGADAGAVALPAEQIGRLANAALELAGRGC